MQDAAAQVDPTPVYTNVALTQLHESPLNRKHFSQAKLDELTESVRTKGIITPLLVRPRADANGYDIAAGHRRFRAATAAGRAQVPCIVRPMSDVEFLEVLTTENLQREDVHELEEAEGYALLMKEAGYDVPTIASKVGKSPSYVYQRLKLAELTETTKQAFLAEDLTAGHAILLARLQPEQQDDALAWATARQRGDETASVRALNQYIHEHILLDLTKAPFDPNDETLVPTAGACGACPFRAGNQQLLFPDVQKGDTCTAPSCYRDKVAAHLERIAAQVQQESGKKPVRISLAQDAWGEKKLKGVLYRGSWPQAYRLIDADGCPHAETAVVFHRDRFSDDRVRLGAVVTICREPKCRKGEPHAGRRTIGRPAPKAQSPAERRKARDAYDTEQVERLTLANLNQLLVEHATTMGEGFTVVGAPVELLRILACGLVREMWADTRKEVARRRGWLPEKDAPRGNDDPIEKRFYTELGELEPAPLFGLCIELALARSATFSPHFRPSGVLDKALELKTVAKLLGVDVTGARQAAKAKVTNDRAAWNLAEMKRATAKTAKKKAPPTTKPKAAAKKKRKKAARAAATTDHPVELGVPCPTCKAAVGKPCKRPSGHRVFGGGFHAPRTQAAAADVGAGGEDLGDIDDGPACETCGCIEEHACEGGCGWDTDYRDVGRFVCTTPICGQQAALRDKRLAKKNGRAYSGPVSVRDLHTSAPTA